jgi:Radical SAM superfamily/B12 binding domain
VKRPVLRLVQLPVPQPAVYSATGNVPLAAGCLAVAARTQDLLDSVDLEVVDPAVTDVLGDTLLADEVARGEPEMVGLSLYLWNTERSLHLAREVKRRSPKTTVLVGGPEVGPDNPFLLGEPGYDVAVSGEAEEIFGSLLRKLVAGEDLRGHPGVAVRSDGGLSPFGPPAPAGFPLTAYPSPYLSGLLSVDPGRATYVETVRGCRSHCTFCFYPRSSAVVRALSPGDSADLIARLRDLGAGEVVFLDPTFNHRPEFQPFLEAIRDVNSDHRLRFFAEIRAEGLTERDADLFAAAGFTKLEIGLQSVNQETLTRTKRGGSPAKVAAAAKMLHARGIKLLVDLIIGLPGDGAADVARGVDFLLEHGLGDEAQVFPLAVLPGTAMRADAARDGLVFDPVPPYRILRTATMDEDALRAALFDAEDRLSRRLDETPRPHLVSADGLPEPPDRFEIDLDRAGPADFERAARPGAQHVALWIRGRNLYAGLPGILRAAGARIRVDPHARLDVVLAAAEAFPLDVVDGLHDLFRAAPQSYLSRSQALRGEDAQRRVTIVIGRGASPPADWIEAARSAADVFREMTAAEAVEAAEALGEELPGALITDEGEEWRLLCEQADPDAVAFASRRLEAEWTRGMSR